MKVKRKKRKKKGLEWPRSKKGLERPRFAQVQLYQKSAGQICVIFPMKSNHH